MVRNNGATALADDPRVRHVLGVADIANVIDDVIGVFLKGVVGRAVEGRSAAIVIDTQTAADVHVFNREAHLVELGVKTGGFLHGAFDNKDVRHLRADVKMKELEAVAEVLGFEHLGGLKQLGGAQAELGILTAAFGPLTTAFAEQPGTHTDHRFDPELFGNRNDLAKLFELLNDHDHALAELDAEHGHANELGVFVAVTDDEAADLVLQGQACEQLRLAANLQAVIERPARIQDLLHDFAELVDLYRKHSPVMALVIKLGNRVAESGVDGLYPVPQDILEANQQRELQSARLGFLEDIG